MYDVGRGQKMFLSCTGSGLPTVILDAPTGCSSEVWALVVRELSSLTKVCVYDRAGLGNSDRPFQNYSTEISSAVVKPSKASTVERMVDDLHTLITYSSQQPRPLLLVGAELGALVTQFYTQLYEFDVADIVLINPIVHQLFDIERNIWSEFWLHLVSRFQAMQLSAAVGLARLALLIGALDYPMSVAVGGNTDDVVLRQKHGLCNPRHLSSVVDEFYFINDTLSQMRTIMSMKSFSSNVSVTLITTDRYEQNASPPVNEAWRGAQREHVTTTGPGHVTTSSHVTVSSADRRLLYTQPDVIIRPVQRLVQQWRTDNKLT